MTDRSWLHWAFCGPSADHLRTCCGLAAGRQRSRAPGPSFKLLDRREPGASVNAKIWTCSLLMASSVGKAAATPDAPPDAVPEVGGGDILGQRGPWGQAIAVGPATDDGLQASFPAATALTCSTRCEGSSPLSTHPLTPRERACWLWASVIRPVCSR